MCIYVHVCVCLYFDLYSSLTTLLCLLLGPQHGSLTALCLLLFLKNILLNPIVLFICTELWLHLLTWVTSQQSYVPSKVTLPQQAPFANISAASGLGLRSQSPVHAGILAGLITCR